MHDPDEPTLFPHLRTPSPPEKLHLRTRPREEAETLIRPVKKRYQVRLWLPATPERPSVSMGCGLYVTEEEAAEARNKILTLLKVKWFVEEGKFKLPPNWQKRLTPLVVWRESLKPLIAAGVVPARVLPLWVFEIKAKKGKGKYKVIRFYSAKVKHRGVKVCVSSFQTPERAHQELARKLSGLIANERGSAKEVEKDEGIDLGKSYAEQRGKRKKRVVGE